MKIKTLTLAALAALTLTAHGASGDIKGWTVEQAGGAFVGKTIGAPAANQILKYTGDPTAPYAMINSTAAGLALLTDANAAAQRTSLSLGNVENTALSTWAGTSNLTTLGTVSTGTWSATAIAAARGGTGGDSSGQSGFPKLATGTWSYENAATHRTSIGATTVGGNILTLANPSAITFLRINADNTVDALDAASFLTAIGAGSGNVATDAIWDAAGDLAVGSGANTAAKLSMGTALQVLRVNAAGTALEYGTPAGSPGGADTQGQFNDSGAFGGVAGWTVNKTTGAQTQLQTSLGTSTLAGYTVTNTTAAAAGAQQVSPALVFRGNGWKTTATAASQAVEFGEHVLPVQGAANPTGTLKWRSQINAAGWTDIMNLSSIGDLNLPSTTAATSTTTGAITTAGGIGAAKDIYSANNAVAAAGFYGYIGRSLVTSPADGKLKLSNNSAGAGVTLNFAAGLSVRNLADNAAETLTCAALTCGQINSNFDVGASGINTTAGGYIGWAGRSLLYSTANGKVRLSNATPNAGVMLNFTGTADTLLINNFADNARGGLQAGTTDLSGVVTTTDATDATSGTTGSVKMSGGLGVVKNVVSTGKIVSTKGDITLAAAATAIAVTRNVHKITGDAGTNTVATITGGVSGMVLTLIFVDALVTISDNATATTNTVNLAGTAVPFVSTANSTLTLVFDGTSWFQTSSSVN